MAILKHISSKNASYGDALEYLKYKHREDPVTGLYEPVLDQYGLLQERENYALCSLDGLGMEQDPEDWAGACMETNILYRKNNTREERKQHIYIISHPAEDVPLLTKELLLEEGKAFARENLPGYDALIAVHMDTDHPHIHIAINSVRTVEREERPWMMHSEDGQVLSSEVAAGGKHQDNPSFRHHCQDWLLEYTRSHGLTMEDNNRVEAERKAKRVEERYGELSKKVMGAMVSCNSVEELRKALKERYDIDLICRGRTYSLHTPERKRNIRLTTLGISNEILYAMLGNGSRGKQRLEREENIRIEKKKYSQWLYSRRQINNLRSEDTIAEAAWIIARKMGPHYHQQDFQELHDLIRQTTYMERDLRTEHDKITHLLDRWELALSSQSSPEERAQHSDYVRWCGCDPESISDYRLLCTERQTVYLQIEEAETVREALVECADRWTDQNQENRFQFQRDWAISREEQLRQELKSIQANRKKLQQIAFRCQEAAGKRIYKQEYIQKAEHFRELWHETLLKEKALKDQIRETKKQQPGREAAGRRTDSGR